MRVLVTGGTGFLGRHVAVAASAAGHDLVLVDRQPLPPYAEAAFAGVPVALADVTDQAAVTALIARHRPEVVVHLAAALTDACAEDPARGAHLNCVGTAAILTACGQARVPRVLYASSMSALASGPGLPRGDDRPLGPGTPYGATKAFGELLAATLAPVYPGTTFLGLRFGYVYGFGRDRGWRAIQKVIEDFAAGLPDVPYPAFDGPLDWTHADDAASAVVACLASQQPSRPAYHVAGDCRWIGDAVAHLQAMFPGSRGRPVAAALPAAAWDFRSDAITRDTGFRAAIGLEAGIERTVAALRAAGPPAR